jgi:hypothetical protein
MFRLFNKAILRLTTIKMERYLTTTQIGYIMKFHIFTFLYLLY